jgi:hypothetical protein
MDLMCSGLFEGLTSHKHHGTEHGDADFVADGEVLAEPSLGEVVEPCRSVSIGVAPLNSVGPGASLELSSSG